MVELARASVRNIPRPAIARLNSCLFQAGASASAGASPQRRRNPRPRTGGGAESVARAVEHNEQNVRNRAIPR
jgi:hypothetical protein